MTRRWTEAEVSKLRHSIADDAAPPAKVRKAYRSQWEAEYAGVLELRKRAGDIVDYGYERIRLLLPGGVIFKVDFDVLEDDGGVSIIEVKGFMREVARIKLRSAIEAYPGFRFYIVGASKTLIRMYRPDDVPSARKVVA